MAIRRVMQATNRPTYIGRGLSSLFWVESDMPVLR